MISVAIAETRPLTDVLALRAIAHPSRIRLYELLSSEGPATVSHLAERMNAEVGTLSYHLRQLASYGYVEEATELASDRRERWWRAVPGGLRWSELALSDTPGGREASDAAERLLINRQIERLKRWHEEPGHFDDAWRAVAFNTDVLLLLAPDDLRELAEKLGDLIHTFAERARSRTDGDGKRQPVFFFAHGFPVDE